MFLRNLRSIQIEQNVRSKPQNPKKTQQSKNNSIVSDKVLKIFQVN